VKKIIREATEFTIKTYCATEPIASKDFNISNLSKDWMSLVLVVGDKIKVSHMVFFSLPDVEAMVAKANLGSKDNNATYTHYMKEFSNTTGGKIKQLLALNNVDTNISLPLCTRTCRDIHFFRGNELFEHSWLIETEVGTFVNLIRCQLIDVENLTEVKSIIDLPPDEIDFL
jgi:hypothetical protein